MEVKAWYSCTMELELELELEGGGAFSVGVWESGVLVPRQTLDSTR
jgi:hypothetical protein